MKNSMPQIEELPIEQVKPYEKNPRINDEAVPKVAAPIRDFGWKQPIVIDKNGVIVAGHTRYAAALSLKMTHVPCIRATDLTDAQVRAYRLADNKTNEYATWDASLLDEEIDALPEFDMKQYGFGFNAAAENDVLNIFGEGEGEDKERDGAFDETGKISLKVPAEYKAKIAQWLRDGGRALTVRFMLIQSGCISEGDDVAIPEQEDTLEDSMEGDAL